MSLQSWGLFRPGGDSPVCTYPSEAAARNDPASQWGHVRVRVLDPDWGGWGPWLATDPDDPLWGPRAALEPVGPVRVVRDLAGLGVFVAVVLLLVIGLIALLAR